VARAQTSVYGIAYKGPGQLRMLDEAGVEVIALTREGTLHVTATPEQLPTLRAFGIKPRLLQAAGTGNRIADLDENLGAYRTYDETVAVLQGLVAAHPTLASLSSIGSSVELRSIYVLKISDNVATDEIEPEVLLMGCHHARELMSVEMPLKFAEYLLANYGIDPEVTQMVDEREIWIAPCINPDGYVYVQNNHTGNPSSWWRKNRRDNGDGSFGVDLNRNYGYNWGHDELGSRSTPSHNLYRGPAPFSEPETQAVRDFVNSREFVIWLSYHSYSELLLYPWGYDYDYTSDHEIFLKMGERMTASNGYFAGNTAMGAIYLTNGGSDDWGYGESVTKPPIFAYTPEVGSLADGGFGPPDTLIQPYFDLLLPMNLQCLEFAGNPAAVLGPVTPTLLSVHSTPASELVLTWSDNLPADPNPALTYDIDYYRNPSFLAAVDAEGPSPFVALDGGFVTSSNRAFEGSNSYYSGMADNLSSTVAMVAPFRVSATQNELTCWMWYDIESDWDYAYVEVSEDQGLVWRPIPGTVTTQDNPNGSNRGHGITGSSSGWISASFPLDDFLGQEIQVRMRYVTDGAVLEEGLYVDFLGPVPSFDEHAPLVTGVPGTSYTFTPAALGAYLYRVRGTDADNDISRWSPSLEVQVDNPVSAQVVPPAHSSLGYAFPNPFNPSTSIAYTIAARRGSEVGRDVLLVIHDVAGRRVATLVQGTVTPGHYRAEWNGTAADGTRLASGTYFARLRVDGADTQVRKLVMLK
jgi:hypothetical protein